MRISAATPNAKMTTATLSTANAKATGSRFGGSGGASELGSGDCVAAAIAKAEILRVPFPVSPQVNGASEGGRQPARELSLSLSFHLSICLSK